MNKIIKTTYKELSALLDEYSEDEMEIESYEIDWEQNKIITFGALYVLEDLGISVIEGLFFNYNKKLNCYDADFSLTIIYETTSLEDFDYNNYAYWEQDAPPIAIHNYLNIVKRWSDL